MNIAQQYVTERRAFVQTLLSEFPLLTTKSELKLSKIVSEGFELGQPIPMEDGRWFSIARAGAALIPGRLSFGHPAQFLGNLNKAVTTSRHTSLKAGEKSVLFKGLAVDTNTRQAGSASSPTIADGDEVFPYQAFESGSLRIATGQTFYVGGNKPAIAYTEGGNVVFDLEIFLPTPLPSDIQTTAGKFFLKGNKNTGQVQSGTPTQSTHIGGPLVNVPNSHFYYNLQEGPYIAERTAADQDGPVFQVGANGALITKVASGKAVATLDGPENSVGPDTPASPFRVPVNLFIR